MPEGGRQKSLPIFTTLLRGEVGRDFYHPPSAAHAAVWACMMHAAHVAGRGAHIMYARRWATKVSADLYDAIAGGSR